MILDRFWAFLKLLWSNWKLAGLLVSLEATAARLAIEKVAKDRSFHPTKMHRLKRNEAQEWASVYLTDRANPETPWLINFLIEWELGKRKGKL